MDGAFLPLKIRNTIFFELYDVMMAALNLVSCEYSMKIKLQQWHEHLVIFPSSLKVMLESERSIEKVKAH